MGTEAHKMTVNTSRSIQLCSNAGVLEFLCLNLTYMINITNVVYKCWISSLKKLIVLRGLLIKIENDISQEAIYGLEWFFYLCKLSGNDFPRSVLTTHLNLLENTVKTKAEKLSRSRLSRLNYLIDQFFFYFFSITRCSPPLAFYY